MLLRLTGFISTVTLCLIFSALPIAAQNFAISQAGEINLDTDEITSTETVSEYFGMYVDGLGESTVRIQLGDAIYDYSYTFQLSSTRLVSYLFGTSTALPDDAGAIFRRGVVGQLTVSILDKNGTLHDSATLQLDVTLPKRNCRKYTVRRSERCARVNLESAPLKQRQKLARVFGRSIRGPIVLEPITR